MEQVIMAITSIQETIIGPCLRITLTTVMLACCMCIRLAASAARTCIARMVCAQ